MLIRLVATFAAALGCCASIAAPTALAQQADTQPEIVVTGVRPEQLQTFVERISAVPPAVDQMARWDDDICLTLAGLPADQGQAVVDQVSYRARAIGLRPGGEGCRPNVFVFFASDGHAFTRDLVDEHRSLFAYYHEEHVATLGREALTSFVETVRPVRWWHVIQTRGADGTALGSDQAGNSSPPPPRELDITRPPDADGITGAQAVRSNGSRIRAAERQDFNRVIIVVDGNQVNGFPAESIADYIAMVTLAQIDPSAQTRGYPTILNLFAENPDDVSLTMTDWDAAYLDGLYRSPRNAASVTQQMRDISRRMAGGGAE